MEVKVFCPVCGAAGFRKLVLVAEPTARGIVYPYCKGCKNSAKILLLGNGDYQPLPNLQPK